MSLFSVLKDNSKRALKGYWGTAICALLIACGAGVMLLVMRGTVVDLFVDRTALDPTLALHYGFNEYFLQQFAAASLTELAIILAFSAVAFFLLSPLRLGVVRWNYELVQGRPSTLSEMFRYFETGRRYRRCLWLELNLLFRTFLWALLYYIVPSAILTASTMTILYSGAESTLGAFASVGVLLAGALYLLVTVFFAATINRYALAAYLIVEDEEMTVSAAIKASIQYTRGYRFSLFWFELSFIGWLLLCFLFLPLLYVGPYMNAATAMYARYIIEKSRYAPQNPTREFRPAPDEPATQPLDIPLSPSAEPPDDPGGWQRDSEPQPNSPGTDWPTVDSEPVMEEFHFPQSQHPPAQPEHEQQQPDPPQEPDPWDNSDDDTGMDNRD